jgi:hypothetical protein
MEKNSLLIDISYAVRLIEQGRRKHFVTGQAEEGLSDFKDGSAALHQTFTSALATKDLELILSAEYYFLEAGIEEGAPDEVFAKGSAEAGLEVIEDALLALKAVADSTMYKGVDLAYPHHDKKKWRYKDMPKDAFHVFCASHKSRLQNGLTRFGVSQIGRELITLRFDTISAIEEIYCEMQRQALLPVSA